MKTLKYSILYMICFICSSSISAKDVKYIEIRKVDMSDKTFFDIDCDNFEKYFNEIRFIIVTDMEKIRKITNLLDTIKKYPSDYIPDVRAKLLIYYTNNTTDTVCMSYLGILINGMPFELDKELVTLIENIDFEYLMNILLQTLGYIIRL